MKIDQSKGYPIIEGDAEARAHEDTFTDHEGVYRRMHVAFVSDAAIQALATCGDGLHVRPGVQLPGELFVRGLVWEQWEAARRIHYGEAS